jgi:beta-mannosidase
MRKAQFGFGWDWDPRLPTIGIWRPVELRRERRAAIRGVHFSTLEIDSTGKQALWWPSASRRSGSPLMDR